MSLYKKVLGIEFNRLHPKLQYRYLSMAKRTFRGVGQMEKIKGTPWWLFPLFRYGINRKLIFPEKGEDIPFWITNTPRVGINGEEQVHWERKFQFDKHNRYFNALMSLDSSEHHIKDYLGEPPKFYSDLIFNVDADGGLLILSSRQRLVLGKVEIPLPRVLQGIARVREGYCDTKQLYTIKVEVKNPIIGRVFSYEGVFKEDDYS